MATQARIEQQPAAKGTTFVVMVGLGIVFLLFMAFLNVVKSGSLISESNLLYAALIFYCGAATLYLGFGITGHPVLRSIRLPGHLGWLVSQHGRCGAPLV